MRSISSTNSGLPAAASTMRDTAGGSRGAEPSRFRISSSLSPGVGAGPGEILHEIEERGLGPLEVVEDDNERPASAEGFQEPADRPEGLLRTGLGRDNADDAGDARGDELSILDSVERSQDLRPGSLDGVAVKDPAGLFDELCDRPEGDPVPVRQAAPAQNNRLAANALDELAREAGLAHPGRPENCEEASPAALDSALEASTQKRELPVSAHQRRIHPPIP
jgi:hypothetical protein